MTEKWSYCHLCDMLDYLIDKIHQNKKTPFKSFQRRFPLCFTILLVFPGKMSSWDDHDNPLEKEKLEGTKRRCPIL